MVSMLLCFLSCVLLWRSPATLSGGTDGNVYEDEVELHVQKHADYADCGKVGGRCSCPHLRLQVLRVPDAVRRGRLMVLSEDFWVQGDSFKHFTFVSTVQEEKE